ncbi:MAG TPA: D-Ala-D-Ala carboxypeptidase family metallohydrolase [Gemmatimonadaceae bacterium]|nr:D-Ala-D-Ala carboxypeptidase family metallohydrolase [Gemmatimonadaceae bacterium]
MATALAVLATFAASSPAIGLRQSSMLRAPFAAISARASQHAFGWSGRVNMRVALPNQTVDYPIEVAGTLDSIAWRWVRVGTVDSTSESRSLNHALRAPEEPGFYRLALQTVDGATETMVDGPALAVLVPFEEKQGNMLNGYRIGRYVGERQASAERPSGFLEIGPNDLELQVSDHLRMKDFLTHDGSDVWPRYVALEPELLDKLELVVAAIASQRGGLDDAQLEIDVHSGFRTPLHNRTVKNSARDSRHQYGDAADIVIDADGNGVMNSRDLKLIVQAVEQVEAMYPELKGGLGIYSRGARSYVHIDVRGEAVRWTA